MHAHFTHVMYHSLLSVVYGDSTENLKSFVYKTKYLSNEIINPIAIAIAIFNYNII